MKLYHITDKDKLESIFKTGLIKEKRYSEKQDNNEVQMDRILDYYRPETKSKFDRRGVYFYPTLRGWKECVLEIDGDKLDSQKMWAASSDLGDDLYYAMPEVTLEDVIRQEKKYVPVAKRNTAKGLDSDLINQIQKTENGSNIWTIAKQYWDSAEVFNPSKKYPDDTEIIYMGSVPVSAIKVAQCKSNEHSG